MLQTGQARSYHLPVRTTLILVVLSAIATHMIHTPQMSCLHQWKHALAMPESISCIWKCLHAGLPTPFLVDRRLPVPPTCSFCGHIAIENIQHVVWDCPQASQDWTLAANYLQQRDLWCSWSHFLQWLLHTNFKKMKPQQLFLLRNGVNAPLIDPQFCRILSLYISTYCMCMWLTHEQSSCSMWRLISHFLYF